MGASLSVGALFGALLSGDPEGGGAQWTDITPMGVHSPGTLRHSCKGALEMGYISLYGSSVRVTWRGGSFARDPEGYERKALGMGISLHGGSAGQPGVGSSTGDFEIW